MVYKKMLGLIYFFFSFINSVTNYFTNITVSLHSLFISGDKIRFVSALSFHLSAGQVVKLWILMKFSENIGT